MFKVGDKVICINIEYDKRQTQPCPMILNEVYIVNHMIGINAVSVWVNNKNISFGIFRFKSVIEFRKEKIKKICSKLMI